MKKVLSLVLVIAMVLSSFSFAFAANFEDVKGDYEEAIKTLVALGVVTGYEDGTYRPERVVTRAEMAKLIVEILGYGNLVAGSKSNFADTQGHWADAWIALAAGRGLVVGTGDGKFTPDRQVSYDEAITMVVRALGYTDNSNELKGMSWPTNFKVKAAELKLLNKVKTIAGGADRGGVAQLLYNALEATLVTVTTDGDVTYIVDKKNNNVLLLSRLAELDEEFDVTFDTIDEDSKYFAGEVVDLEPYLFQNLQVYLNDDDQVVYVKDTNSLVLEGILNDVDDVTDEDEDFEDELVLIVEDADEDDNKFVIDKGTLVTKYLVNGVATDLDNLKYTKADVKVTVVLDAEADDKIVDGLGVVGVVAVKATDEILVNREYVAGRTRFSGVNLPVDKDDDVDMSKIVVEGAVDALEDVKEDSVVTVYAGLDAADKLKEIRFVVSEDSVEGKITKTNYDKTSVTIGGKAYDASPFADNSVVVGETGTLYLNADGEFRTFTSEDKDEVGEYAVVVSAANGTYDTFLEANDKDAKVKLATAANKDIIYSLAEEAEVNGDELEATGTVLDLLELLFESGEFEADLVVEYSLDKDGKIDWIEEVVFDKTYTTPKLPTDTKAFILADNAVIFDGETEDAYQVLNANQLADDISAKVLYNKDGEIELLFVTDGVEAAKDGIFAVINNVEVAVDDNDDTVLYITAFINGEKVSYFTDEDFYLDNVGTGKTYASVSAMRTALRGGYKLNELTMDGNVITGVTTEGAIAGVPKYEGKVYNVKAASDVFTILVGDDDTEVLVLADDAIVYLQTGAAVVEVEDIYELDADDEDVYANNEGDLIKAFDTDDDGEIDIVIIKQR